MLFRSSELEPELVPAIELLTAAVRERRLALSADDSEPTPLAVAAPHQGTA